MYRQIRNGAVGAIAALIGFASSANAVPMVPTGYEVLTHATGGLFAGRHLSGIATDPGTGDVYVATDGPNPNTTGVLYGSFILQKITPAGMVSTIGSYGISHRELTELEFGPDGHIYTANTSGTVFKINPSTGVSSVFSNSGIGLARHSLEFEADGDLILMPEGAPNRFHRVNPGSGTTFLGSYNMTRFEHGDRFGIQPDGDYVIYPDGGSGPSGPNVVTELDTTGHVDGTNYPVSHLTSTVFPGSGSGIPVGYSIGAIDPLTGDVFATTGNFGLGSSRIMFTPAASGLSTVFVDNIGTGVLSGSFTTAVRGVTDLDFGARSDGLSGHSLYFLDDFTDTVYEVRTIAEVPEPRPLALFGLGLAGLGFVRRRKPAA